MEKISKIDLRNATIEKLFFEQIKSLCVQAEA